MTPVPAQATAPATDAAHAVEPKPVSKIAMQTTAKAKPPAATKTTAAPAAQLAAKPVQNAPPAAPALDLAALEQRLRDTHAIGLFTKLSLKNQVDDLLNDFRAHFHGQNSPPPLTALRQRYDLLMLKVLTLLQDSDPPLATAISSSREAIWGVLNDPAKLTAI